MESLLSAVGGDQRLIDVVGAGDQLTAVEGNSKKATLE